MRIGQFKRCFHAKIQAEVRLATRIQSKELNHVLVHRISEVFMKGRLLLLALVTGFAGITLAFAGDGKDGEDVLRKSGPRTPVASYPLPFTLNAAHSRTVPPISTGYYFVDSDDEAPDFWRPDP